MLPQLKAAIFLVGSALTAAFIIPCGHQETLEAVAGGTVYPSGFWQISQQDKQSSINLYPFAPNGTATFTVRQSANAANKLDLIASFDNIPCSNRGPATIQFIYNNPARAGFSGNAPIEVFSVTGALPVCRSSPLYALRML